MPNDKMTPQETLELAKQIANAILDEGLANSTWRDTFPDAYYELLALREDLADHIYRIILESK